MIFLCLGTQEFQFDRLLKKVDDLLKEKIIEEEVFAQVGYSSYIPSKYKFKKFLDFDEFDMALDSCSYVITHGGTGTIIKALRKGKKVIAIPRLKQYGEHVDDHQIELISIFAEKKLICGIYDINQLEGAISKIRDFVPERYISCNSKIIAIINEFIKNCS